MKTNSKLILSCLSILSATLSSSQAIDVDNSPINSYANIAVGNVGPTQVVYDNLSSGAIAGYTELNANNPIFGDSLTLYSGGALTMFGASLYNSTSGGNTGSILTGTMQIKFYDNTVPYAGGAITGTLLGSANISLTFGTGLAPGFFTTFTSDLSALNINLTQNILVTQQFTELTGTSLRNGVILFGDPTTGSSPNNLYINSSATAQGLYSFGGTAANSQFGYHVEVVPEPATFALAGLGSAALLIFRRRK